jgi:hypothetical protein
VQTYASRGVSIGTVLSSRSSSSCPGAGHGRQHGALQPGGRARPARVAALDTRAADSGQPHRSRRRRSGDFVSHLSCAAGRHHGHRGAAGDEPRVAMEHPIGRRAGRTRGRRAGQPELLRHAAGRCDGRPAVLVARRDICGRARRGRGRVEPCLLDSPLQRRLARHRWRADHRRYGRHDPRCRGTPLHQRRDWHARGHVGSSRPAAARPQWPQLARTGGQQLSPRPRQKSRS